MRKRKEFKTQYKTIDIYESDWDKLDELCRAMKIAKCKFLNRILEGVWDVANQFITNDEMGMLVDSSGRSCSIVFYGKSAIALVIGKTDVDCRKQVEDKFNLERTEEK